MEIWPSLLKSSTRDLLFILLSCLRFRRSFLRIFSLDFLLSPPTKNIYIYIYFIILESSRAVAAFFLNPLLPFTISMAVLPRGIIPRDTDPWILTDWSFYMERRGREGRDRFHLRWTCLFLARFLPDHLLFYLDTGSIYSLRWNGRIYRISSSRRDVSTDSPLFRVFFKIPCTPSQAASGPGKNCLRSINRIEGEMLVIFLLGRRIVMVGNWNLYESLRSR